MNKPKANKKAKNTETDSNQITFDVWFALKVAKKELKIWHKLEIATFFFHDNNLKPVEDKETYDKIFKLY